MDIIVLFEARAVTGGRAALLALFAATLPQTRAHPGCRDVVACTDPARPDHVVLVERWASRADYDGYLAWRQGRGDFARLEQLLAGPPDIRLLDPATA